MWSSYKTLIIGKLFVIITQMGYRALFGALSRLLAALKASMRGPQGDQYFQSLIAAVPPARSCFL